MPGNDGELDPRMVRTKEIWERTFENLGDGVGIPDFDDVIAAGIEARTYYALKDRMDRLRNTPAGTSGGNNFSPLRERTLGTSSPTGPWWRFFGKP